MKRDILSRFKERIFSKWYVFVAGLMISTVATTLVLWANSIHVLVFWWILLFGILLIIGVVFRPIDERSHVTSKKGRSNNRLNFNKIFALTLIIGFLFTGLGYHLLTWADNPYYAPQSSSLQGRVTFYFLPAPAPGERPMMLNVALSPLVDRTNTSYLHLSVAGNFPGSTPWVSFLCETSFQFVGQSANSSSGTGGAGNWRKFDWHSSTGQPETLIQFLFNRTNPATDRLSFIADIAMNFTGLPFSYDRGRYTILVPFNPNGAGYTIDNGFLTISLPEGTFFSSSNEPQQVTMPVGTGSGEYIQSRLNQSSALVITYDDPATEKSYSDNQTWPFLDRCGRSVHYFFDPAFSKKEIRQLTWDSKQVVSGSVFKKS